MHVMADPMANVFAHHAIARFFSNRLNRMPNITKMIASNSAFKSSPHALLSNLQQALFIV